MMTQQKTQGFTLIELVIVIVLLGILTATALPRFLDLSVDAKRAANLQIVAALNTAHEGYKLQAQSPLTPQSPFQPTTSTLFIHYQVMRVIDAQLDTLDGGISRGTLLFFYKNAVAGGAVFVKRDPTTKRLLCESTGDPLTQDEDGIAGTEPEPLLSNLDQRAARVCVRIFNILLNSNNIRSAITLISTPGTIGALNSGANPNSPFAYQAFFSQQYSGTPINPSTGSFETRTAWGTPPNYGKCLWVRTDSITSTPVFYIYYNVYEGKFIAVEAES